MTSDPERAWTSLDVTRRAFLRTGAAGLTLAGTAPAWGAKGAERSVILLLLVGGPSQLETWDPKPDAPEDVRGPFGSIATAVPGVRISAHLPRLARRMDRLCLIRSMHHDAPPIHESGYQLIQTGRPGAEAPHFGAVVARAFGAGRAAIVPGPLGNTGFGVSHGDTTAGLGPEFAPVHIDSGPPLSAAFTARYGDTPFGRACLTARRLVESGVRAVTVNMFDTVFHRVTWDCHGSSPFSTLDDYARQLLPTLDLALSALLDDLEARGLLDSTLVVATGEFGRTPRLNAAGGRDHWPDVWSALLAGGGTCGGQVIGASDPHAAYPADRPVSPADLLATIYRSLGFGPSAALVDGGKAVAEVFG